MQQTPLTVTDPCQLFQALERHITGRAITMHELSTELPVIKQEEEQLEETPYVEVMEKLMSEFSKIGMWGNIEGAQTSPGVLKLQT